MKKVLYINTGDRDLVEVRLVVGSKVYKDKVSRSRNSQIVLNTIDKVLSRAKIKPQELTEIEVFTGPGSFTGLRVGIAIGNAFARSLNIKINGKKQVVDAKYE